MLSLILYAAVLIALVAVGSASLAGLRAPGGKFIEPEEPAGPVASGQEGLSQTSETVLVPRSAVATGGIGEVERKKGVCLCGGMTASITYLCKTEFNDGKRQTQYYGECKEDATKWCLYDDKKDATPVGATSKLTGGTVESDTLCTTTAECISDEKAVSDQCEKNFKLPDIPPEMKALCTSSTAKKTEIVVQIAFAWSNVECSTSVGG